MSCPCGQKAGSRERWFLRLLVLAFTAMRWGESFAVGSERPGSEPGDSVSVDRLFVKVFTPEGTQIKTLASEVSLPGLEGRLGILRGHAPLVAPLSCGLLRYKRQGKWVPVVLRGGFMSVKGDVVTILTNDAERARDIPLVEEAKLQLEQCTQKLGSSSRTDRKAAVNAVRLASARLQAAMLLAKAK
eukprot:Skav200411  [mRNA]  locus=scaffold3090:13796:22080:- [translate_table: standard]